MTKNPDKRITTSGITVCSFTVAVNRRKGQDNETDYFRCSAWRELAESCAQYLKKGSKVCVWGSVSVSTYKAQDGTMRASMDVTASDVEFLTPRESKNGYEEVKGEELPWG